MHPRSKALILGAVAVWVPAAALADVAPLTPEGRVMMQKRQDFEAHARTAFRDPGLIEKLRDWRKHWGFVLVGKEGSRGAPRVLVKDEYGWYEMRPGATKRLPTKVGHELNRLLTSAAVWNEQPYNWGERCQGTPRLFVIMHAGKDQFGRLGCGPEGLAARAARIAETLNRPARTTATILPARIDREVPRVPRDERVHNADIFERLSEAYAAWERKTLAGFVELYAENAIVETPDGPIKGRKAVVEWARDLQDWTSPYTERDSRRVLHQMTMPGQQSDSVRYTTHELRWMQEGKPVRQTFSTMWRNNAGLWQIAHQRMSAVKPVTDGRPI